MTDVRALLEEQVLRRPHWDGVEHADPVIRLITEGWTGVLWSELDAATADAIIAREIERFAPLGRQWEWKHYSGDQPADLPDRLRAAGFVAEDTETLLAAAIADLPTESPLPDGVRLHPVSGADDIALLVRVQDEVFDEDNAALGRELLRELEAGSACAVVAMAGDRPICAGRVEFFAGTDFAGLWGGGTLEQWRRQGVFKAVVAWRTAQAAARGCRYLYVDASDDSCPILKRLGFEVLGTTTPFIHP